MCELEAMIMQLLELAKQHSDLSFRILPNKDRTNWNVEFTKGGIWWGAAADHPGEELKEIIRAAIGYFDRVTEDVIQAHKDSLVEPKKH